MKKRLLTIILIAALTLPVFVLSSAKTTYSSRADNIFVYAEDVSGKSVLLKTVTLTELKKIAHGSPEGGNYYVSSTDNYPTTQYCEARGVTVPELLEYVKSVTTVADADRLSFAGGGVVRLMATDSFGNYNRSWTHDELYGVPRYYFEGLFSVQNGWNPGWEIAGEDAAKFGISLDEYNAKYKASDPFYDDKRAVFNSGVQTVPILATESFSGRTTTDTLVASTEIGIAEYIAKNGGIAAGSLAEMLSDETALRLSLPMTETDLMTARRTAFDNFKWIYNLKFEPEVSAIKTLGTVAEPVASITNSGDKLTITLTCETPGAVIYYSLDDAPQLLYSEPVTVDVSGRNLAAEPFTFYMTAVREGYDDAGFITAKYPGLAPAFKTQYGAMAGRDIVFTAADGVSDWEPWIDKMTFITIKKPNSPGYVRIEDNKWTSDNETKTVTFDKSLLTETGSYSFVFHASGYADKSVSLTVKRPAPDVTVPEIAKTGMPLTFRFADDDYQSGLSVYVTPPGGDSVMISSSRLGIHGVGACRVIYSQSTLHFGLRALRLNSFIFGPL